MEIPGEHQGTLSGSESGASQSCSWKWAGGMKVRSEPPKTPRQSPWDLSPPRVKVLLA